MLEELKLKNNLSGIYCLLLTVYDLFSTLKIFMREGGRKINEHAEYIGIIGNTCRAVGHVLSNM